LTTTMMTAHCRASPRLTTPAGKKEERGQRRVHPKTKTHTGRRRRNRQRDTSLSGSSARSSRGGSTAGAHSMTEQGCKHVMTRHTHCGGTATHPRRVTAPPGASARAWCMRGCCARFRWRARAQARQSSRSTGPRVNCTARRRWSLRPAGRGQDDPVWSTGKGWWTRRAASRLDRVESTVLGWTGTLYVSAQVHRSSPPRPPVDLTGVQRTR
jgi:hypothetical protein